MIKHCGQPKFLFSLVAAALFCLTLAAPQSGADTLHIGPGVDDSCWMGGCPVYDKDGNGTPEEINLILGDTPGEDSISVHYQGDSGTPNLHNPVLLIFAVPIENLLFPFLDGAPPEAAFNPGLSEANILYSPGAKLYNGNAGLPLASPPDPGTFDVDVDFPASPAYMSGFSQGDDWTGTPDNLLDFLALVGNSSEKFADFKRADFEVPRDLALDGTLSTLGLIGTDAIPGGLLGMGPTEFISLLLRPEDISGYTIWVFELETSSFGKGDTIHIETTGIPLGTFVSAWGHHCDPGRINNGCTAEPPLTEIAIMMPIPAGPGGEIPEPTSLLLLGTGLLAVGRQWRKRQTRNQSADEKQNMA